VLLPRLDLRHRRAADPVPGDSGYLKELTRRAHGPAAPRTGAYRGFVLMCSGPLTADLPDYHGPARQYLDLVADRADEMVVVPGSHKYATRGCDNIANVSRSFITDWFADRLAH
jgi:hypothetical protein